jgi:hypothetical protein
MGTLRFNELPLVVKIAVGVVFYSALWSIEEFVIDHHGFWKYMPQYKVADPCIGDLAVGVIISLAIWRASRKGPPTMNQIPDEMLRCAPMGHPR